jgi:hypothetical protein
LESLPGRVDSLRQVGYAKSLTLSKGICDLPPENIPCSKREFSNLSNRIDKRRQKE